MSQPRLLVNVSSATLNESSSDCVMLQRYVGDFLGTLPSPPVYLQYDRMLARGDMLVRRGLNGVR